ncbi:CARDB domain-containing protein [Halorubrum halophilum]|uniref:CARDB domain-containing protein n=1 Tax=Halorubrum halophilum TaxID=413816 RepID=UPI0006790A5B|nr:CARDB domain-containing protein [Halorubrum halophilum]
MPTARRTLILALVLVAAGSLIFTTGAAVIDGDADTVADGDLAIQPADGPNGQYAYLNDDEIAIDVSASNPNIQDPSFEGVNVGTTGTIDDVFTITYTADEYAHVWIQYESENVTFVADGDSIEGEANNVTLAPNETVVVGLALDTRGAAAGTKLGADEFGINATLAEPEDASMMSASTRRTSDAGPTTTVTSTSDDRREFVASDIGYGDAVRFDLDGMHLDGGNVTLDGLDLEGVRSDRAEMSAAGSPEPVENGSALDAPTTPRSIAYLTVEHDFDTDEVDAMTIRFSASREALDDAGVDPERVTFYRQTDAGDWNEKDTSVVGEDAVRTRGLSEDRVHFRATTEDFSTFAVAERVPRFDVTEATLDTPTIDPGEAATVRATVRNGGGAAGERPVTLTADGDPVANETVALAPNETATVALSVAFETAGEYDLAVDGADAGDLLVGDPASDDGDAGNAGDGEMGDGDTRDAPGGESTDESGGGPTEEPAGIDLVQLGGLLALVALVVVGVALVRRTPRS